MAFFLFCSLSFNLSTLSSDTVAPTEALSPDEQQEKFKLPDGFEIQLVVSEPDIGQPMNLNFDARGRLWITHSIEYPYPAKAEGVENRPEHFAGGGDHPPRDKLTIIDLNKRGKKRVIHFAEGLNIPIGQTPLGNGDAAIVFSIPNIYLFKDTDGDGKADKRKLLYGKFGNRDTHGMASSFTRWIDGWIYGCHGFSNTSEVHDASGNVVRMHSGNTYRFREDGSRFEQFTWGQVNPFGMTFDPLGNLYNSDCHSMPINLLLRGAQYPHWNRPGPLGFGPKIIFHPHGSTGISGPAFYSAKLFPEEYRDNIFICNPVNGVVHRDHLKHFGSTGKIVDSLPDFLTCDDPWFRPVDSIVGPDGALYIADFYNAIIGHYEVPLSHPKRDRERGRVWRVVYKETAVETAHDLTHLRTTKLIQKLSHPNLAVRVLATNYLVDTRKWFVAGKVRKAMQRGGPLLRAHGLWVLERSKGLKQNEILELASDDFGLVRTHLMRALAERKSWSPGLIEMVQKKMSDKDPFVRRAAADALGQHPHPASLKPLLTAWLEAEEKDTLLIHTIKLALRSHFDNLGVADHMSDMEFSLDELELLMAIVPSAEGSVAAGFALRHLESSSLGFDQLKQITPYLCRHSDTAQHQKIIQHFRRQFAADRSKQFRLFELVHKTSANRKDLSGLRAALSEWLKAMSPSLLQAVAVVESKTGEAGVSFLKLLGTYALTEHTRLVISIAENDQQSSEIRLAAAEAGIALGHEQKMLPLLNRFINGLSMTKSQKTEAIDLVAGMKVLEARETLANAFTSANAELQNKLALALCKTSEGAEALLQKIGAGKASARILQDKKVNERFMLKASAESRNRANALLKNLPPADQELAKKIRALRDSYLKASTSESRGKSVFKKICAACHRLGTEGATVGPQLDGIGRRGPERLLEDILDPNRNVDAAFNTINIATREDEIFSGLKVSDDAQAIVIVDSQAKRHRIPRNEIKQIKPSRLSPMPSGYAEVMKKGEIHDLLAYLISMSDPKK